MLKNSPKICLIRNYFTERYFISNFVPSNNNEIK